MSELAKVLLVLLAFYMIFINELAWAMEKPSLVMLAHTNNTGKNSLEIGSYVDDIMLTRVVSSNLFEVYERKPIKEIIEAEDKLVVTKDEFKEALKANSFTAAFFNSRNDLCNKKKGDYVNPENTSRIGQNHNVKYLFHCTLDNIGTSKTEQQLAFKEINALFYANTGDKLLIRDNIDVIKQNLQFIATFRLIKADNGEIVWLCSENTIAKDYKVNYKYINFEENSDVDALYVACVKTLTEKVLKRLKDAVAQKEVVL